MESLLSCDERLAALTARGGLPTAAGPVPADAGNSPLATSEGEGLSARAATHMAYLCNGGKMLMQHPPTGPQLASRVALHPSALLDA